MTWADRAADRTLYPRWWIRISGLPYVFSDGPCPSEWDTGGGVVEIDDRDDVAEEYTWSPTLALPDRWEIGQESADRWTGRTEAGGMQFQVRLPGAARYGEASPWGEILSTAPRRGAWGQLVVDLAYDELASMELSNGNEFATAGLAYLGRETIYHTGKTATSLTTLTRGRFWSIAQSHFAAWDGGNEEASLGGICAEHPIVLGGRVVWVMCSLGQILSDGCWHALDASPEGAHTRQMWRGILRAPEPKEDQVAVTLQVDSLLSVLEQEVGTRLPHALAGEDPVTTTPSWYIGEENWWVSGRFEKANGALEYDISTRLQRSDYAGGAEDVPSGWYSTSQIQEYLGFTLSIGTTGENRVVEISLDQSSGETICKIMVALEYPNVSDMAAWFEVYSTRSDSIWREFGFDGTFHINYDPGFGSAWQHWFFPEPDNPVAQLWHRSGKLRPLRCHAPDGPSFTEAPGWTNEFGAGILGTVKIGDEEIVAISDVQYEDDGRVYMDVAARSQLGSGPCDIRVDLEDEIKPLRAVQGIGLVGVSLGRRLLYLLLTADGDGARGDYDAGWRGCGIGLDPDIVDADTIATLGVTADKSMLPTRWIDEPTSVWDCVKSDLVLGGLAVVTGWASDGRYCITLAKTRPPLEDDEPIAIDHTVIDSTLGVPAAPDESRIVNAVVMSGIYHNWATGEGRSADWVSGRSVGTYGRSQSIEIDLRGIGSGADRVSTELAARLAGDGIDEPPVVAQLPITRAIPGWTLQIGDVVSVENDDIWNPVAAARGISGALGRVFAITRVLRDLGGRGSALCKAGVTLDGLLGRRHVRWAPTVRVHTVEDELLTCTDHWNSHEDDPVDASRYAAGYFVRIYQPGNESTAIYRTVVSVTLSVDPDDAVIEVDSAVALTPPLRIEFAHADSSGIDADQLLRAYLSDGSGEIDLDDGVINACYYEG